MVATNTDLVLEHVRRWIDFHVEGPPQGDPHGRVVRFRPSLIVHDVLFPGMKGLALER